MTTLKSMGKKCIVCGSGDLETIYFGKYGLSQSFESTEEKANKEPKIYSYAIQQCGKCHHIQAKYLHPSLQKTGFSDCYKAYDLRTQSREPEHHFEELCRWIKNNIETDKTKSIAGFCYKDISLMELLNSSNSTHSQDVLYQGDDTLKITHEMMQHNYNYECNDSDKKYDLIIARHILEHIPDPVSFLKMLNRQLNTNGSLYLELPYPSQMVGRGYVGQIWEEHCSYFTEQSIRQIARQLSMSCTLDYYENGNEPLLCCILKKSTPDLRERESLKEIFPSIKKMVHKLEEAKTRASNLKKRVSSKSVYFFGAGHIGIKFINFLEITELLKGIIDDHPKKAGKLSVATGLKVIGRGELPDDKNFILIHAFRDKQFERILGNDLGIKVDDIISIDEFFLDNGFHE